MLTDEQIYAIAERNMNRDTLGTAQCMAFKMSEGNAVYFKMAIREALALNNKIEDERELNKAKEPCQECKRLKEEAAKAMFDAAAWKIEYQYLLKKVTDDLKGT